jgi:hypothetical protein
MKEKCFSSTDEIIPWKKFHFIASVNPSDVAKSSLIHCWVLLFHVTPLNHSRKDVFIGENRDGIFFQRGEAVLGKSLGFFAPIHGKKSSSLVQFNHLNYLQNALVCVNNRWLEAQPSIGSRTIQAIPQIYSNLLNSIEKNFLSLDGKSVALNTLLSNDVRYEMKKVWVSSAVLLSVDRERKY